MAALVCDLCGGKLVMGAGGIATCDSCGMEYSSAWLKEKVLEVKGTVRVDNSHLIENYLEMAQQAIQSGNNAEAENYCNKIIEIMPEHASAWLLKGRAAGWQSTLGNIRFSETLNCFANAVRNTAEEDKATVIEECKQEVSQLSKALLRLRGERFAKWPDEDELSGFLNDLSTIMQAILQFYEMTGASIDKEELISSLAIIINNSVIDAWNNVIDPEFKNDNNRHPDDYALTKLVDRAEYCTTLLETAIRLSGGEDESDIQRYENLITIHDYMISACSYEYQANSFGFDYVKSKELTKSAKDQRRQLIKHYRSKINAIKAKKRKEEQAAAEAKARAAKEAAQRRYDAYWAAHAGERAALTAEHDNLNEQINTLKISYEGRIAALKQELSEIPGKAEAADCDARIQALTERKKSLGIFKSKEKKLLQEQIDQAEADRNAVQAKINAEKEGIEARIAAEKAELEKKTGPLQVRVKEINDELTKERSNLGISANALLAILSRKFAGYVLTGDLKAGNAGFIVDTDNARKWNLMVAKQNGAELQMEGVWIHVKADNLSSEVELIHFECNETQESKELVSEMIKAAIDEIAQEDFPFSTIKQLFSDNVDKNISIGNLTASYRESITVFPILDMKITRYIVEIV